MRFCGLKISEIDFPAILKRTTLLEITLMTWFSVARVKNANLLLDKKLVVYEGWKQGERVFCNLCKKKASLVLHKKLFNFEGWEQGNVRN